MALEWRAFQAKSVQPVGSVTWRWRRRITAGWLMAARSKNRRRPPRPVRSRGSARVDSRSTVSKTRHDEAAGPPPAQQGAAQDRPLDDQAQQVEAGDDVEGLQALPPLDEALRAEAALAGRGWLRARLCARGQGPSRGQDDDDDDCVHDLSLATARVN